MKNLLIPIEESELLPSVLQSAVLVARRFGSYLEGLHVALTSPAASRRAAWEHPM